MARLREKTKCPLGNPHYIEPVEGGDTPAEDIVGHMQQAVIEWDIDANLPLYTRDLIGTQGVLPEWARDRIFGVLREVWTRNDVRRNIETETDRVKEE